VTRLYNLADCTFLVLAFDGLRSKVSNQDAIDAFAWSIDCGNTGVCVSMNFCKELFAMARSRGSRDDIRVMIKSYL
jgi:protein phosphatase 1L